MNQKQQTFVAIIGGGNIAQAIVLGASVHTTLEHATVVVAEPDAAKRELFKGHAQHVAPSAPEAVEWLLTNEDTPGAGQIMLAVKPQTLSAVAAAIRPVLDRAAAKTRARRRVVISLLAGTATQRVRQLLGGEGGRIGVVRVMPNLAIRVHQGMTAIALGAGAQAGDEEFAQAVFGAFGDCIRIDESLMDAFTAVAGSGPAYVFFLAEAMARAAVEVGFDAKAAERIVRATIAGAGRMLAESSEPSAMLRAAVSSKGGTTEAALKVLDAADAGGAIVRAIVAARDRGRELGTGPPT